VYEGRLKSSYLDIERDVRITVEQTWTRILIRFQVTAPESSSLVSMSARLNVEGRKDARLTYTYRNATTPGVADPVQRGDVVRAIEEYDRLGQERFLADHGFGRAKAYLLVHNGRSYDSKAILGVAYKYSTGRPVGPHDFNGGMYGRRCRASHSRIRRSKRSGRCTPSASGTVGRI